MTFARTMSACLAASLLLSACSTRPRNFSANLSAPVADRVAFESDFRTCQQLVAAGHTGGFKAAAAQAATAGLVTMGSGAAIMGAGIGGVNVLTGAASSVFLAAPVIGLVAGFGLSRAIRGGKERKYKAALGSCLGEYGYAVGSWSKLDRGEDAAHVAALQALLPNQDAPVPVPATDSATAQ